MTMADKLEVFNAALDDLGHAPLSSLTENIEAQRILTRRWDRVVADCISEASWNFAVRGIMMDYDPDYDPSFGYQYVFEKPDDWVRTLGVSGDENHVYPLLQYYDDATNWSADISPIYVRYVSNGASYGLNLAAWPAPFTRYVELELAVRGCMRITQNDNLKASLEKERDEAKKKAKFLDAMDEAQPRFPPPSGWTQARWGRFGGRDRGSRGSLIG